MKKVLVLFAALLLLVTFSPSKGYSQATNNVVLELCTGTWCQWCPCGHQIADLVLQNYPTTLVLEYHGGSSDPFSVFNGNEIISMLGMSAYPTGTIGRRTGVISRSLWYSQASYQATLTPDITIQIVKTYNPTSRQLDMTANVTSLRQIDSTVNINFVLLEDKVIYPQTGNSSCPGGSNYMHNHIVRNMVNGAMGTQLSTGTWTANTLKSADTSFVLPSSWVAENCEVGVFCYFPYGALSSQSYILNSGKIPVQAPTGIGNENGIVNDYSLSQNYPNPFNPVTNIQFSIPEREFVTFKIYDILGNEVATYYNDFLNAGKYNVEFNGAEFSSGVYFYRIVAGSFTDTKKMMLMK